MVRDKVFGLLAGSIFALAPYAAFAQTGSQQWEQKGHEQGQQKGGQPGYGAGLGEQPKGGEQCDCPCGTPGATPRHHKGGSFGSGLGGEQPKQGTEKGGSSASPDSTTGPATQP